MDVKLQSGTSKHIIDKNIERLMNAGYSREEAKKMAYRFAGVPMHHHRKKDTNDFVRELDSE